MGLSIGCSTKASRVYQRRTLITMACYVLVVVLSTVLVKHVHPVGWLLYALAVLPAVPLMVMLGVMARYLTEENDEYLRLMTMRSLLVATGALMGLVVVSDFLRTFAQTGALPPFVLFLSFFIAFAIAQGVQKLENRGGDDE